MPQPRIASGLSLPRHDRLVVLAALSTIVALTWTYLGYMSFGQPGIDMDMGAMAAMPAQRWDRSYFIATMAMWVVMMIGMMVPSATPTILLFGALQRQMHLARSDIYRRTALFVTGYVVAWIAFSALATTAQWGLDVAALRSSMTARTTSVFGGLLFLVAAAYQFIPLKTACLRHCRNPAEFLVTHRRSGRVGPLLTGLEHGMYCIGCCWGLMALLFAFGVMNLLWVGIMAIFIFIEKLAPAGVQFGRIGAVLMICASVVLIANG